MGVRRRKGATESGRIERPRHCTTTAGESVHDAETGSKAREPRDNRRTSQGAAVARRFAREGAAFVARTCPTKSTVVQPHLSALSCVPITCTAALVPRAKERANLVPLSTLEYASSTHELATRSSSEGTMDPQSPQGGSAARVCFGIKPTTGGRRAGAHEPLGYASGRVREYASTMCPPHVLYEYPNHAARTTSIWTRLVPATCTCTRARRETHARRPRGREGGRERRTEGVSVSTRACESFVHVPGVCDAANHMEKQRRARAAFVRWHGTRYGRTSLAPPGSP